MRIIRLTTLLDFGGQEKQYISFTDHPEQLENTYYFGAIGYGGRAEKELQSRGFATKVFNLNPSIKNLRNIWVLFKWFKELKPDIIHTAAVEANIHGVIAAKLAGVPKIYAEEIGIPNHSLSTRLLLKLVYKLTDRVVCVSHAVKNRLIELGELKPEKGIVLYNPVSMPKNYIKKHNRRFHMVYVGRLEMVKNVEFLIRAINRLKDEKEFSLTIVGDGRLRSALEDSINEWSLGRLVDLVGFSENPEKYVSQADLFILPSLSEGFGIAVVEAMFQGVPCLCSRVGGIPEFIEDGVNGWLFNPNNENEFLQKLSKIMELPSHELVEIGKIGQQSVMERFTSEIYIKKLEDIYCKYE